jgi:hypothetical protein
MTYEHAQASQEERDSNHTDPEIQALKNRYIVGKLSGEDILDRQGKVIVAKNSVITEAAMLLAEREGKLVELILNMIIPGMEE